MLAPDVNVLVYAHREDTREHAEHAEWRSELAKRRRAVRPLGTGAAEVRSRRYEPADLPSSIDVASGAGVHQRAATSTRLPSHTTRSTTLGHLRQSVPPRPGDGRPGRRRISRSRGHRARLRVDHKRHRFRALPQPSVAYSAPGLKTGATPEPLQFFAQEGDRAMPNTLKDSILAHIAQDEVIGLSKDLV